MFAEHSSQPKVAVMLAILVKVAPLPQSVGPDHVVAFAVIIPLTIHHKIGIVYLLRSEPCRDETF
jgi:hypothetical protein